MASVYHSHSPINTSVIQNSQKVVTLGAVQKRRRAPKACLACRSRKVRCNAVHKFPSPCTNCQFDDTECVIPRKDQPRLSPPNQDASLRKSPIQHNIQPRVSPPQYDNPLRPSDCTPWPSIVDTQIEREIRKDAPAPLTSVTESSDQQSVCSLSLPDLNLMDFFNGCSPTSIQPYVDALNEPINYNMDQDFAQNLTPCLTTWASDDAIMDPFPKEGQADSLSLSSGTAAHSTKAVQHEVPQHEAPQLNFGMEGSCVCAPSCHAGLAWVSLWCTRQLDDNTRSKLENVEALKVPPLEVMHALIEQYFLFANGQVPCVNEYDTYRLLRGNFPQSNQHLAPMSLALLNAILFAASGFSTVAQAEASGFLDICNMRTGFYRRAKALYDAGCETRSMDRLRICLLLSTYRSCTTINNEASSWLVEAQKILLKVDIRPLMTQSRLNADEKQWKLLYGCYILRTCTLITGSRCGGSSLDLPTMGPRLRLEDLLDLECTWLLDSATKRKVADLFLAIQSLSLIAMPFSQLLKRHSADVLLSTFEMHESEKSLITELQDLESLLAEWLSEHKSVLLEHPWPAAPTRKDICLFAVQSSVKLSYEYFLSLLHQLNLVFKRPRTSAWTAMMLQTSRKVIQESASTTVGILEELAKRDVLRFIPDTIIPFVLVPLTISTVTLKASSCNSVTVVRSLSTCYTTLGIFAERYEIVDYYLKLSEMCTALTHERVLQEKIPYTSDLTGLRQSISLLSSGKNASHQIPLPPAELYSVVLRALEGFFVHGITETTFS